MMGKMLGFCGRLVEEVITDQVTKPAAGMKCFKILLAESTVQECDGLRPFHRQIFGVGFERDQPVVVDLTKHGEKRLVVKFVPFQGYDAALRVSHVKVT